LVAGLSMILRKQDCSEEAKTLRVKAMGIQTRLTDGKFIKKRQKFQGGPPSKDLGPKTRPIKDKR